MRCYNTVCERTVKIRAEECEYPMEINNKPGTYWSGKIVKEFVWKVSRGSRISKALTSVIQGANIN
jgi:hypothetical protein